MNRRKFAIALGTVTAAMVAGSKLMADDKPATPKGAKHDCKGQNTCKANGGCKSGDNGCAGKNSCKGKGGCAVPVKKEHMQ
jgi:hypothetical protein